MQAARALRKPDGRRSAGAFLVEGPHAVAEALHSGTVREVFATTRVVASGLLDDYRGPRHLVDDRAAAALSETVTPQGVVAVCDLPATRLDVALAAGPRLAVLLAEVADPGNAGTVLRTADAAGAQLVIVGAGSADAYGGKAVRSAAGSHFHLDVVTGVPHRQAIADARAAGLRVLATAGSGDTDLDAEIDSGRLTAPTLWVFGHEARGLPDDVLALCDAAVRIPIHGRAESLNLAAAAAVVLYASARAQTRSRGR